MNVEPYLFFEGRTEEALEFYRQKLGAKVEALMRYKDNPDPQYNPDRYGLSWQVNSTVLGEMR